MNGARDEAAGFTLIELLIALLIMGIAVGVLVTGMADLVYATSNHRGYSVAETLARSYGEALQRKATFTTTLTAAIDGATLSIPVADITGFPSSHPFDVVIEQETIAIASVTAGSGTAGTLNASARHVGPAVTPSATHAQGATVSQLFICPTATYDASADGHVGYIDASNFQQSLAQAGVTGTASITGVEYWDPTHQQFATQATCLSYYQQQCPIIDTVPPYERSVAADCDPGLERVDLKVALDDSRLGNVTTTTVVLIRRGFA